MNSRRQDLLAGLLAAVALHCSIIMWADNPLLRPNTSNMVPAFQFGLSALPVTLVQMDSVEAQVVERPKILTEPAQTSVPEPAVPRPESRPEDSSPLPNGVESSPSPASSVRPVYPLGSRIRGEEGLVVLKVLVDAGGRPLKVAVETSSGFPALDQSALHAVESTVFVPGKTGDRPRAGETSVSVRFRLTD